MGPTKLARTLNIELPEAKDIMNRYFAAFPEVKKLMDKLVSQAKKNKYALSPLDGRRRDMSYIDWDDMKKVAHMMNVAKNLPFQGCGASITKLALINIDIEIKRLQLDAKIILVIHDEILVECHNKNITQCSDLIKNEMIKAFNIYAPDVPMEVNPEISDRWVH